MAHFDAKAAKALPPGGHLLVQDCPGLRLMATASTKTWTYRYKADGGKLRQVKLGEWPKMGLGGAVSAWQAARDGRADGIDPVEDRRSVKQAKREKSVQTCSDLLHDFLDGFIDRQRKPDSAGSARSAIERLLAEDTVFASMRPAEVNRAVAYRILDDRRNLPMATKKLRSLLGQAWERAHDAGLLDPDVPNWWRQVMHGQLRSKGKIIGGEHQGRRLRVLRQSELSVLLPWARKNLHSNGLDGMMLYLLTGMRGAELFSMRPEYIAEEHDGWWMTFPASLLKMERHSDTVDHRVPLMGEALEIVQRRMTDARGGWLFWTERGGLRKWGQKAFSTYCVDLMPYSAKAKRRAGEGVVCPVTQWSAHDLRRTARTLLGYLECPDDVGEAIIGHKPPILSATYNLHTFDAQKRAWLQKLATLLGDLERVQDGAPALPNPEFGGGDKSETGLL